MKRELIVVNVQRYGILYLPDNKYIETGFRTRFDANASLKVIQQTVQHPDDFSVVETTPIMLKGTKEQIEGWLERGLHMASSPSTKENHLPKCPVFTFNQWGYMKGSNGVDHENVWFEESALKSKGKNLLKRLSGTKSKPRTKTVEEKFNEFMEENPLASMSQKRMFVRRCTGTSNKMAYQILRSLT